MTDPNMRNVVQFIPRKDLTAQENLDAFVTLARDLLPTWGHLGGFSWESAHWPTTYKNIRFVNHENISLHHSKALTPEQLMHPAFMQVAKAYVRHHHHIKEGRVINRQMQALRVLEYVLRQEMGVPDITQVSQRHIDQAMPVLGRFKAAPNIAQEILLILRKLADYAIVTPNAHHWQHSYHGASSYARTRGELAPQDVKDKKMPDQDSLLAIAEVFARGFHQPLEDCDVLITSLTALLLSVPMRIMEARRFRVDCIDSDQDKDGKTQYYLKYWVPKINAFARKPIPETMADTAIEAVRRLTEITKESRRLASYLETNPTQFYRHAACPNVPDDQLLTREQVVQALGFASIDTAANFLRKRLGSSSVTGYTLNSLWQIVLAEHRRYNPHFPYQEPVVQGTIPPLKMSESLLCCLRNQFSTGFLTSPILLAPFNLSYYANRLSATQKKGKASPVCFFTRHGFEATRFKSHSARHFLNRLAKQSGVSIDVITSWSSRSTNRQTLAYLDNDQGAAASAAASLMGQEVEHSTRAPVTNDEAELYAQGPIHRSRYGLCLRSWRVGPCNKFADCLNCSDVLICKGDRFATEVIASERDELAKTYFAAHEAIAKGERSATRWVKVSGPQIQKLDELLSILNNAQIPDGSPITITGPADFNHEQTLVNERAEEAGVKLLDRTTLAIEYGADLLACLDELRN
jgi:hypothetical protein